MALDYKIETIREYLKGLQPSSKEERQILFSILDVLQDVGDEINEINHSLYS